MCVVVVTVVDIVVAAQRDSIVLHLARVAPERVRVCEASLCPRRIKNGDLGVVETSRFSDGTRLDAYKNGRRFGRKLRLRSFHRLEEVMCLLQKLHAQPEEGRGLPFKNDRHDHARARGRGAPSEVFQISAMRGD